MECCSKAVRSSVSSGLSTPGRSAPDCTNFCFQDLTEDLLRQLGKPRLYFHSVLVDQRRSSRRRRYDDKLNIKHGFVLHADETGYVDEIHTFDVRGAFETIIFGMNDDEEVAGGIDSGRPRSQHTATHSPVARFVR